MNSYAMSCPHCTGVAIMQLKRKQKGGIKRTYRCKQCSTPFQTMEVILPSKPKDEGKASTKKEPGPWYQDWMERL